MTDDAWQLVQDMASLEASKRLSLTKVISSLEHLAKADASIDDPDDEGMRAPEPTESSSKCTTDSVSAEENAAIIEAIGLLRSESESTRYNSLQTLYRRAHSVSACRAIKQADGFRWVFHCLQDHCASLTQRLYACGILDQMICASELPGNESSRWRSLVGILPASLFTQLMETLASSHEDHVIVEALDTLCIVGNVDSWENGNKLDFIPPVTSLLRIGTPSMQAAATLALRVLVRYNEPAQLETVRCGAVMLLLNQLDVGTDEVKYHSARTLTHLAAHDTNAGSSRIIRLLMASAQNQRSDGSSLLALSMIGEQKYTQRDIVEAGVFPLIVKLIQTGKESEKTYAALSKGDFARGDMYTEDIIGAGGVEALLQLVQTGTVDEKESAIYALSCIAEFHERTRAVLMEPDVLRSIPALLRSGDEHARFGCVTWIERVANLDGAPPVKIMTEAGVIGSLLQFARTAKGPDKHLAVSALISVAGHDPSTCLALVSPDLLTNLIKSIEEMEGFSVFKLLRRLLEIPSCECVWGLLEAGALTTLSNLVFEGSRDERVEVTDLLGLIARRDGEARLVLIQSGVVVSLVEMARDGDDRCKTSAAYALGSIMKSKEGAQKVKKLGGTKVLLQMLKTGTEEQQRNAKRALSMGSGCCRIS